MASMLLWVENVTVNTLFQHPVITGTLLTGFSLAVGVGTMLAADFGTPAWMISPSVIWLLTGGLPTFAAVLTVLSVWGTMAPFYGLIPFAVASALLAVLLNTASIHLLQQLNRSRS